MYTLQIILSHPNKYECCIKIINKNVKNTQPKIQRERESEVLGMRNGEGTHNI